MNVIFTGGGSGGHVLPAMALIAAKPSRVERILYIGSRAGLERELCAKAGIEYSAIPTGKLRRYVSLKNVGDFFRFAAGIAAAWFRLRKFDRRRSLVFSTGGFVALPAMVAARLLGIPSFLHEQTSRAGLANRLSAIFARKVFISFQSSRRFYPVSKTIYSGYPLRPDFLSKEKTELRLNGVALNTGGRPLLFVTGGGNGSRLINEWVVKAVETSAFDRYFWVHQTGPQWAAPESLSQKSNYLSTAFVGFELPNLMKWSTAVVCRGGAGTLCELRALQKSALVVPLKIAQQNEQWHNALEIQKSIPLKIVPEDEAGNLSLTELISELETMASQFSFPKAQTGSNAEVIIWENILDERRS